LEQQRKKLSQAGLAAALFNNSWKIDSNDVFWSIDMIPLHKVRFYFIVYPKWGKSPIMA